jgi:general secretion pathway protein M
MELPGWISRLAAVSLLVGLAATAYVFVVPPLVAGYVGDREALADARERLGRYRRIAATRPDLQAQIDAMEERGAARGNYLTGRTDALAAAELQNRVKKIIETNGGKLRSIQTVPGKADGGFQRVTIRVQLAAPIDSLHRIIYALEAEKPFLFLDNIDIGNRRRGRRKKAPDDADPALTVRFDLFGYLQPEME